MNTEHYASRATIFVIRNQNLTRLDGDGNLLAEYEDFWIKLKQEEGNKRKKHGLVKKLDKYGLS